MPLAEEALEVVEQTYLALLQHPLDKWRAENQRVLARLRWFIAKATNREEEDVQNEFEDRAVAIRRMV